MIKSIEKPQHAGSERYTVLLVLDLTGDEQQDLYDTRGKHVQFEFRPATVKLVWDRFLGRDGYGPWKRVYAFRGSRIEGPRVTKTGTSDKQFGHVEVWHAEEVGGPLTKYAAMLPGLEQAVADLEKNLPA